MVSVLDREIEAGNIEPVVAVFVDSRDPNNLSINRRNNEFMCNQKYAEFYMNELLPTIEENFPVSNLRENRVIAGVSFGGLNASCFGLMVFQAFSGIGMQSPASSKHLKLMADLYKKSDKKPIKVFLSIGTKNDNTKAVRRFHRVLIDRGYEVKYLEVPFGHTWKNWQLLIDDLLITFFASKT